MEVLVLNKSWIPVRTTNTINAIYKVYLKKAKFISKDFLLYDWEEWVEYSKTNPSEEIVNGVNFFINKPVIIIQIRGNIKLKNPRPTRKNIFLRDCFTCQYCGEKLNSKQLTIDHVCPRSRGGKTTWDNSVSCCPRCNNIKADKNLNNSGLTLIKKPFTPTISYLFLNSICDNSNWSGIVKRIGGIK